MTKEVLKQLEKKVFASKLRIGEGRLKQSSKTFDKEAFLSAAKDMQKLIAERDRNADSGSEQ